jgi:NTP pyrophosphatase (non-canonical NTP hydrolase)
MTDLDDLAGALADFAAAREWEQFHTPKNLSMALAGEAGELLAELQWLPEAEIADRLATDPELRFRVADEVADVLLYTVRFAAVCGIDPLAAAYAKIDRNQTRYPADRARGSAAKHTEYRD